LTLATGIDTSLRHAGRAKRASIERASRSYSTDRPTSPQRTRRRLQKAGGVVISGEIPLWGLPARLLDRWARSNAESDAETWLAPAARFSLMDSTELADEGAVQSDVIRDNDDSTGDRRTSTR
jgi:hypothetical protein